jgi:DNA modification methylase
LESIPETLDACRIDIGTVQPYDENPREGDVGALTVSLERNGQYRPIVVNRRDMRILAGNHTWKAAQALGWGSIAATFVDVDDEAARRIVLVDNRSNDVASYDEQALADLLQTLVLEEGPEGLVGTGFDGDDLDQLLADLTPDDPDEGDPAPVPVPETPRSVLGDVWKVGPHRIVCGDSSEPDVLDRLMAGATAGCVLTDPPYGINLDTDYSSITGSKKVHAARKAAGQSKLVKAQNYRKVQHDDEPFNAGFLSTYFADVVEQFWFGANYYRRTLPGEDLDGSWLVWDKRPAAWNEGSEGIDDVIGSGFELLWSKKKHQQRVLRQQWSGFTARNPGVDRAHPTEKPIELLSDILERWAPSGCVVADPFAGSGTTLLAAAKTGRTGYGIELDPGYVDVICARLQQATGATPILEATGEAHDFTEGDADG